MAHAYARHIRPEHRLGRVVADEPLLGWVFPYLAEYPQADLLVTGGAARDMHLGQIPHEYHLVLRGAPLSTLNRFFARRGKTTPHDHGLHFTPAHTEGTIDISLPRTDVYHPREKTMVLKTDRTLPHSHDANWRDLTMNAFAYSVRQGTFADPYNGVLDLERGYTHTIGKPDRRFLYRPLHALRALRLSGNHGLIPSEATWNAAGRTLPLLFTPQHHEDGHAYPVHHAHIGRELERLLRRRPSAGFELLRGAGGGQLFFGDLHHRHTTPLLRSLEHAGATLQSLYAAIAYPGADTALSTWSHRWHLSQTDEVSKATRILRSLRALETVDPRDLSAYDFFRLFPKELQKDLIQVGEALLINNVLKGTPALRFQSLSRRAQQLAWEAASSPRLRGRDLLARGYAPGPALRFALREMQH